MLDKLKRIPPYVAENQYDSRGVISNLHIEPVETELTEEAFRITGNTFAGLISRECEIDDPRWPECQCDNLPPAEKEACLADLENGGGDPPGGSTTCVFNNHPRNPSGHIRVVDTQLGLQPVKKVKVTLKNNWFTEDVAYTDDNGFFFINSRYRGNAKMKVSFKNSHAKIYSLRQYKVWEYFYAVTDNIGVIKRGPVYTNISVTYNNSTSATSAAKRYWIIYLTAPSRHHRRSFEGGFLTAHPVLPPFASNG